MTGIDKIVEKIYEQAQNNCDEILAEATLRVKEIIAEARAEAARQSEEIIRDAQKEAERKAVFAKSTSESITRNRYLEIRNAILNDIISAAYLEIEKIPDDEYFSMIKRLVIKNVLPGECEMQLSGFDLGRLPGDFEMSVNMEIYENTLC